MARAVQKGNDLFELGNGKVGEVGAVGGRRLMRHEANEVVHAFDALRSGFLDLDGHLLIDFPETHEFDGHACVGVATKRKVR